MCRQGVEVVRIYPCAQEIAIATIKQAHRLAPSGVSVFNCPISGHDQHDEDRPDAVSDRRDHWTKQGSD
jgi:hypothetical protein